MEEKSEAEASSDTTIHVREESEPIEDATVESVVEDDTPALPISVTPSPTPPTATTVQPVKRRIVEIPEDEDDGRSPLLHTPNSSYKTIEYDAPPTEYKPVNTKLLCCGGTFSILIGLHSRRWN